MDYLSCKDIESVANIREDPEDNLANDDIINDIEIIQQALYSLSSIDNADEFADLFENMYTREEAVNNFTQ